MELITIDISNISEQKQNQLKALNNMIIKAEIYSIFHYNKAKTWKLIHWITGIFTIILSSILAIINAINNSTDCKLKMVNTITFGIVTSLVSIFTFLNPTNHRKNSEEAGDRYSQLADDIMNFFLKDELIVTEDTINDFSIRFKDYTDFYYEPSKKETDKIKNTIKNIKIDFV